MRKTLRVGMFCFVIGLAQALGGCAPEIDPGAPVKYEISGALSKKNPVTLRNEGKNIIELYAPADNTGAINLAVTNYNQTNKEDYIRYHELKSEKGDIYNQFVLSRASGDSTYDLIMYDLSWNTDFAARGLISELDAYIDESGLNVGDYLPNAIEAGRYADKQYSLPVYVGISMLYFRRDIINTAPVTWDDLVEAGYYAKDERLIKNSFVFAGRMSHDATYYFMEMLNSYGVRILDENGYPLSDIPKLAVVLEKYKEIYTSYFVPSTIHFLSEANAYDLFLKGESLMLLGMPTGWVRANGRDSEIVGKFALAPIPKGSANANINQLLTGSSIAICSASENKTGAWAFIQYMTGYGAQRVLAVNGGYAPTLNEIYESYDAKAANAHFASSSFRKTLADAALPPTSPNYFNCVKALQEQLAEYVSGNEDLETTLSKIESELRKAVSLPVLQN